MAILIMYRKIRETETEVEYEYGPNRDQIVGHLVFDPTRPQADPVNGRELPDGQTVAGKVLRIRNRDGIWPPVGAIQS